jgi:predicted methyltransferase
MKSVRHSIHRATVSVALAFIAALPSGAQTRGGGGLPPRDEWQRVPEILAAMGDITGKRVADIAAGTGYLTKFLAKQVGPAGRVFAVEIGEVELGALRELSRQQGFGNLTVCAGTDSVFELPETIDAAVVLNSYHEFTHHREMLAAIKRVLRPGGLLVLVDNAPTPAFKDRDEQASHHGLDPKFVDAELRDRLPQRSVHRFAREPVAARGDETLTGCIATIDGRAPRHASASRVKSRRSFGHRGRALDLHQRAGGNQRRHDDRGAGRRVLGKELAVDAIHTAEVGRAKEKHGALHHVRHGGAPCFEHGLGVLERLTRLSLDRAVRRVPAHAELP